MKIISLLVWKDIRLMINDKAGLVLSFIVPMVLILVFGMVLGGSGGGPSGVRILVVDEAKDAASERFIAALKRESTFNVITERTVDGVTQPLTAEVARGLLETNASAYRYAVILPEDFSGDEIGFRIRMLNNPQNSMENAMVMGLFQRAFFTELPSLLVGKLEDQLDDLGGQQAMDDFREQIGIIAETVFDADGQVAIDEFDAFVDSLRADAGGGLFAGTPGEGGDLLESILEIDNEQVFGRGRNIATQSMAGFAAMFLLFGLSGAATSIFDDRQQQILHRLLAGPVSRMQILWGKYLFSVLFGCFQLIVLFAFGQLVFDVFNSPFQLPLVAILMVALSAAATGFGMIICAFARTPAQASGMATFLILTMSALGGAMIPSFMFPAFLRDFISPLTLVHWGVDGFLAVLWRDASLWGILPHVGVLLVFAAVTLIIATPRFLKDSTFSK